MIKVKVSISRVNLKLKFRNNLQGSYDVGRLQGENSRETFQGQLNAKLKGLKFDNVGYCWNILEK